MTTDIYVNKQIILNKIRTEFDKDSTLLPCHFEELINNISDESIIKVKKGEWQLDKIRNDIHIAECHCQFCGNKKYFSLLFDIDKYCSKCGAMLSIKKNDKN